MTTQADLEYLTASIVDARHKPFLAPTLKSALESQGHDAFEVIEALDNFFQERTLQ